MGSKVKTPYTFLPGSLVQSDLSEKRIKQIFLIF